MSWKLHFAWKDEESFHVTGPLGTGVTFEDNKTYIIFVGGTGLLPFLDLFAYLLWFLVNQVEPQKSMFIDEDF